MLQTMRNNAQGIVAKIIVFFIICVFALWGVESIVNLGGGDAPVATVAGQDIEDIEVQRLVEQQKSNLRRQFGEQFDESLFNEGMLKQAAIEQLVEQKVAASKAEELGVYVSAKQIDETIVTIPAFQVDGRFDKDQYLSLLRLNGWSPVSFKESMESDLKVVQVNQSMFLSAFPSSYRGKIQKLIGQEERDISYSMISEDNLLAGIEISPDQAEAFYQENIQSFMAPETVKIRYVGLEPSALAGEVSVTEDEINQAYQDYLEERRSEEQRKASHILIEVNDDRTDVDALVLAESIEKKLAEGKDFSGLAGEYSDDIGTSGQGGDLGLVGKGAFVPEFEDALFALKVGEVSKPVKTEFGYHIIRLDQVVTPDVEPLEVKAAELENWIRSEKSGALVAERSQELANLAFSARSIDEVADALGLKIHESDTFTRTDGSGIAGIARIREAAFADNLLFDGEISELIETEQGSYVIGVSEHTEAAPMPFEAVSKLVEAQLKQEKAAEMAKEKAASVSAGSSDDVDWKTATLKFSGQSDLPRAVIAKAFELAEGGSAVVSVPGGYSVVKIDAIKRAELASVDASEDAVKAESNRAVRAATLSYRDWAKSNTDISMSTN